MTKHEALAERLEKELHKCWTTHVHAPYNKAAFQELRVVVDEAAAALRGTQQPVAWKCTVRDKEAPHSWLQFERPRETTGIVVESEPLYASPVSERQAVIAAVDAEPELPGRMPDAMWATIKGDRDAIEEAMRIAVRQTKDGIRERVRALAAKEKP